MKKKIAAIGLLAIALAAQSASAKSLEDVLKEKGVITEEDYKEVIKSKPFDYKLGSGFTFTSNDEKYQLTLGGRMQFRYTFTDNDGKPDASTWEVKRSRIWLDGYAYTKDLTYHIEIDPTALASTSNYKGLVDAWMNYKLMDEVQLKVGQMKVPWGRQELISDSALELVDRSPAEDKMKVDYDTGAMLNGKIAKGLAYYYLGVYAGAGQTQAQTNNDNMFAARVVVNPLGDFTNYEGDFATTEKPLLSIGADYFRQSITSASGSFSASTKAPYAGWISTALGDASGGLHNASGKFDVDSYGVDAAFKWMGVSLQGEYMLGQAEGQAVSGNNLVRAQGFYTQAGYMIIPGKLEAAVRYSYLDPNRDVANDTQTEQIGGLSYYFSQHKLKLQGDIGNIHQQKTNAQATDSMQYRVQAQIFF